MTKGNMIRYYRQFSGADAYIIGFEYKQNIYMVEVAEIMPRWLNVEKASRNQGENLRLRMKANERAKMAEKAICLGHRDMLKAEKYNRGEIFEKMVTEYFGQTWEKDNVGFWEQGDIRVDGRELQIKLDSATLMSTVLMHKLQKGLK